MITWPVLRLEKPARDWSKIDKTNEGLDLSSVCVCGKKIAAFFAEIFLPRIDQSNFLVLLCSQANTGKFFFAYVCQGDLVRFKKR